MCGSLISRFPCSLLNLPSRILRLVDEMMQGLVLSIEDLSGARLQPVVPVSHVLRLAGVPVLGLRTDGVEVENRLGDRFVRRPKLAHSHHSDTAVRSRLGLVASVLAVASWFLVFEQDADHKDLVEEVDLQDGSRSCEAEEEHKQDILVVEDHLDQDCRRDSREHDPWDSEDIGRAPVVVDAERMAYRLVEAETIECTQELVAPSRNLVRQPLVIL